MRSELDERNLSCSVKSRDPFNRLISTFSIVYTGVAGCPCKYMTCKDEVSVENKI